MGSDNGLFEGYRPAFNEGAPRDYAAQMLYNGIFATTINYRDGVASKVGDDNKDNKTVGERDLNLIQKFAVVAGNDKFVIDGSTTAKGQTRLIPSSDVDSKTASDNTKQNYVTSSPAVTFECDMDLLGLEVKVLYRDPKTTNSNKTNFYGDPDLNSTIYGMTPTGKNQVYNVTKGDLDDEDNNKMDLGKDVGKVKVADKLDVFFNFRDDKDTHKEYDVSASDNAQKATKELKKDSADKIQFVTDNDGNLRYAFVTEKVYAKVSNVTSDKVTFVGGKAIDIDANDIYSGVAKDDVAAVTVLYKAYKDMDDSDAEVIAAKVDTVEGALAGLAGDNKKMTVGDTTYKAFETGSMTDTTYIQLGTAEDYKLASKESDFATSDDLDEEFTLYTDGGYWFAFLNTAGTVKNYGVATGADTNGLEDRIKLMDYQGNEKTYSIDDDSDVQWVKKDGKITGFKVGTTVTNGSPVGRLFRYSVTSSGEVKLKRDRVSSASTNAKFRESGKLFDSKSTADNAIAFVNYTSNGNNKWDAFVVNDIDDYTNDPAVIATPEYALSGNDIVAFVMGGSGKPGSSSNLSYGFVTKDPTVVTISGDKYTQLTVWNGAEEAVINIDDNGDATNKNDSSYTKKRDFVAYELGSNNIVDDADFYAMKDNGPDGGAMMAAALYSFKSGRKSIQIYKNPDVADDNTTVSAGVTDDVKIIYVNVDDGKGMASGTPTEANLIEKKHVRNIVYKMIEDDGEMKVDAIFIDTDNDLYHDDKYYMGKKDDRLAESSGADFDDVETGGDTNKMPALVDETLFAGSVLYAGADTAYATVKAQESAIKAAFDAAASTLTVKYYSDAAATTETTTGNVAAIKVIYTNPTTGKTAEAVYTVESQAAPTDVTTDSGWSGITGTVLTPALTENTYADLTSKINAAFSGLTKDVEVSLSIADQAALDAAINSDLSGSKTGKITVTATVDKFDGKPVSGSKPTQTFTVTYAAVTHKVALADPAIVAMNGADITLFSDAAVANNGVVAHNSPANVTVKVAENTLNKTFTVALYNGNTRVGATQTVNNGAAAQTLTFATGNITADLSGLVIKVSAADAPELSMYQALLAADTLSGADVSIANPTLNDSKAGTPITVTIANANLKAGDKVSVDYTDDLTAPNSDTVTGTVSTDGTIDVVLPDIAKHATDAPSGDVIITLSNLAVTRSLALEANAFKANGTDASAIVSGITFEASSSAITSIDAEVDLAAGTAKVATAFDIKIAESAASAASPDWKIDLDVASGTMTQKTHTADAAATGETVNIAANSITAIPMTVTALKFTIATDES